MMPVSSLSCLRYQPMNETQDIFSTFFSLVPADRKKKNLFFNSLFTSNSAQH
jgi:hypothetical protein